MLVRVIEKGMVREEVGMGEGARTAATCPISNCIEEHAVTFKSNELNLHINSEYI